MAMLHPFDPKANKPRPNPDGTVSTEITRTVQFPDGSWGNVPSLWWGDGSDVRDFGQMGDDQLSELAGRYETSSGVKFPRYSDLSAAEAAARARSEGGGGEQGVITSPAAKKGVTLNINGKRVKVDDSFLALSPEQQNATVDEIAKSLGGGQGGPISLSGKVQPKGSSGEASTNVEGLDAQGSYDLALKRVRERYYPGATDEKWAQASKEFFGPYDSMKLLQAGGTLGLSDEAAGAANAVTQFFSGRDAGQAFSDFSELERARAKLGRQQQGLLGATAEVAGSLFSGRPDLAANKAVGIIPQAIEAGKGSVLPGFIQGFASDDGDIGSRVRSGAAGGVIGGVTGTALGAAGAKLGDEATKIAQSFSNAKAVKGAPVLDDIKIAASDLFNSSKASGTAFTPRKFTNFALDLLRRAKGKSIDSDLDGEAVKIYERMAELAQKGNQSGKGVSLAELHNLRQKAQDVALSAEKNRTRAFAQDIVDGLDGLLTSPKPADMIGGTQAAGDLLEGISLWNRAKKMSLLEEVITKAQYQKSGFENGLRLGFLNLLKNPKTRKLFTPAEIAELERVGKGTLPANLLTIAGKFGFSKSGNGLGGSLGILGALGASGGNPIIAALAAAGASGARLGAEKLTQKAAERAVKAVAAASLPNVAPKMLPPAVAPSLVTGGQTLNRNYLSR